MMTMTMTMTMMMMMMMTSQQQTPTAALSADLETHSVKTSKVRSKVKREFIERITLKLTSNALD